MRKLRIIITGATGMVGEGVLYQCLQHPDVEKVLVVTRKSCGYIHPKLSEIIHADFFDLSPITEELKDYNTCLFCLGVTSLGMSEADYTHFAHTLTMTFASAVSAQNSDMTFCYISGAGTDSSENGRVMWARIKGKTENDLIKLPFKQVFNFRLAVTIPFLPIKPTQTYYKFYKYWSWLLPAVKLIAPNYIIDLKDFATAMINVSLSGYNKHNLEMRDINLLAKQLTNHQ